MKIVAVAGGFDPLHLGHLEHLRKARKLGDFLVVITHHDDILAKKKGYCLLPLGDRIALLSELRCVDAVITAIDKDGTVAETLALVRPDIFAKGGDRVPGNMPQNEIEVCRRLGILIRYGIGNKINSSQELVKKAFNQIQKTGEGDEGIKV